MTCISLLGIPHDANSSYLRGPAEAPAAIRRELFNDGYTSWSQTGFEVCAPGRIRDLGDVAFDDSSDPWDLIERAVHDATGSGDPLIALGGDHAISHPILRAMRRRHAQLTILHIDAHPDIYHAYLDNPRSHASPFARIMEEKLCDRLIQVGLRAISDEHREQFRRFGVEAFEIGRWNEHSSLRIGTPVYISMDIDALDPAHAPGVSHREPGGLTVRQVIDLVHTIDQPVVGADIVEYNPRCDISNLTALVGAKLVKEFAGMMIKTAL